jgi:hypothetical protein
MLVEHGQIATIEMQQHGIYISQQVLQITRRLRFYQVINNRQYQADLSAAARLAITGKVNFLI